MFPNWNQVCFSGVAKLSSGNHVVQNLKAFSIRHVQEKIELSSMLQRPRLSSTKISGDLMGISWGDKGFAIPCYPMATGLIPIWKRGHEMEFQMGAWTFPHFLLSNNVEKTNDLEINLLLTSQLSYFSSSPHFPFRGAVLGLGMYLADCLHIWTVFFIKYACNHYYKWRFILKCPDICVMCMFLNYFIIIIKLLVVIKKYHFTTDLYFHTSCFNKEVIFGPVLTLP